MKELKISKEEFLEYYNNLSLTIKDNFLFFDIVKNSYDLDYFI